jgi:hypothetical protein
MGEGRFMAILQNSFMTKHPISSFKLRPVVGLCRKHNYFDIFLLLISKQTLDEIGTWNFRNDLRKGL